MGRGTSSDNMAHSQWPEAMSRKHRVETQIDVQSQVSYASSYHHAKAIHSERRPYDANYLAHTFHQYRYRGNASQALVEYLAHNNRLFSQPERGVTYHGKFGYVIQGKGSGKSRTCIEMGHRGVFVIYMNLRERTYDPDYPGGDIIPRHILLEGHEYNGNDYGASCCAFFTAIFKVFGRELGNILQSTLNDRGDAVRLWHTRMCGQDQSHRDLFFANVQREYEELRNTLMADRGPASSHDKRSGSDSGLNGGIRELKATCASLCNTYSAIFDGIDLPRLAMVVDEAQWLKGNRSSLSYSPSEILCQIIAEYSKHAMMASIWVVFVSRDVSVANFGSSLANPLITQKRMSIDEECEMASTLFDDERLGSHKGLFAPFTAMGWDQLALPLGSVAARDVARLEHMSRFGRPWWYSVTLSGLHLGGLVLKMARAVWPTLNNATHLLYPRFCLRVDPGHVLAQKTLENSISEQCRTICMCPNTGPVWMHSTYPSEPFLAHLAAFQLHSDDRLVLDALHGLSSQISRGLIVTSRQPRLESRLLLLLCKDHLAQDLFAHGSILDVELVHCRMISLSKFIEYMLGPSCWPEDEHERFLAQTALKNAYVNFSHWVRTEEEIGKSSTQGLTSSWDSRDWLLRLWTRSAAVQCSEHQLGFDQLIPVYFDVMEEDQSATQSSAIPTRDRSSGLADLTSARHDNTDQYHDRDKSCMSYMAITTSFKSSISATSKSNSIPRQPYEVIPDIELPYITIRLDLDCDISSVHSIFDANAQQKYLRLHVSAANRSTFPFMSSELSDSIQNLLTLHQKHEVNISVLQTLRTHYSVVGQS